MTDIRYAQLGPFCLQHKLLFLLFLKRLNDENTHRNSLVVQDWLISFVKWNRYFHFSNIYVGGPLTMATSTQKRRSRIISCLILCHLNIVKVSSEKAQIISDWNEKKKNLQRNSEHWITFDRTHFSEIWPSYSSAVSYSEYTSYGLWIALITI